MNFKTWRCNPTTPCQHFCQDTNSMQDLYVRVSDVAGRDSSRDKSLKMVPLWSADLTLNVRRRVRQIDIFPNDLNGTSRECRVICRKGGSYITAIAGYFVSTCQHKTYLSHLLNIPASRQLLLTYDQGEVAVSYRWTGWVWGIIGWSSRRQENYRLF